MARTKLSRMIASLEDQDGVAKVVDVKEESSTLGKPDLKTSEDDGSTKNEIETAHQNVDAGGKDYTAIDEASKRQGEAIHKQLERLSEASGSLEAYVGILRNCIANGTSVGKHTAAVMRQDLSAQYPKFFSKMTAALEDIDDEPGSESKELVTTKAAAKEGEGRLDKLKGAVAEGWKKFLAWLKERFAKLKEVFNKIFGRTQKVKEANAKLLASPTPETAKEVVALLGAPVREGKTEKVEPKAEPKGDQRMTVTVQGIGVLSGKDPMDMKKQNLAVLKDLHENWMKPTEASVKEVLRLMKGDESKFAQSIDMGEVAREIVKVDFAPASGSLPSGYVIEGTENKWGFKMVQHDQPETITEVEIFGASAVKTLLSTNDDSLDIAIEMGEAWVRITGMVDQISEETKFIMEVGKGADMKKWITEYLTTITNSDIVPLTKLMIQATTARLLLCTEMTDPGK